MSNPNPQNQFKKGVVTNPNGAPKKKESITHLVEKYLQKKSTLRKDKKKKYKQLFVEKAVALALKGDMTAMKLVWNYLDGLPKQNIAIEGYIENPLLTKLKEYNVKTNNNNSDSNE